MELVNRTKLMNEAFERYRRSNIYNLDQAYESYSTNKATAWKYCEDLRNKMQGTNLKVIGNGIQQFSAGFTYTQDDRNYFMFITSGHDRAMDITDLMEYNKPQRIA